MTSVLSAARAKLVTRFLRTARVREEQWYLARFDAPCETIGRVQQHPERVSPSGPHALNWYLPPFEVGSYGGTMTAFRAAAYLLEQHGVAQAFVICGNGDPDALRAAISARFESLASSPVIVLGDPPGADGIPEADFSVATHWTTAYEVLRAGNTGLKFYFIQDWEPAFYAAGSIAMQAEATYRFGLLGICNTEFLRDKYAGEYGAAAVGFTPCVDGDVFHPPAVETRDGGGTRRIFFYGRPEHARNCFELAAEALRRVKRRYGTTVEIVSAGAEWRPREYGLDGVVDNLGLLPYAQTGELYRTCHVGVSMMATLHPSYIPIELMACGVLVVSNLNNATQWCLQDGLNCLLAHGTPACVASTLSHAISEYEELGAVRAAAVETVASRHGDWNAEMEKVAVFVLGARDQELGHPASAAGGTR